jgi:hypothetical protein
MDNFKRGHSSVLLPTAAPRFSVNVAVCFSRSSSEIAAFGEMS